VKYRGFYLLTDNDSQSSVSDIDHVQEEVLIQEASDNEDLFKVHLNTTLVLDYKVFNYRLEGLHQHFYKKFIIKRRLSINLS
jgi:hypothetical protein